MITQPQMSPRSPARPGAGALRGRDIVCFSHDWTGDPLSKTHLMRLLARDNRVLWVNSIGYRAPTASRQDLSRAWKKLAAATRPISNPEANIFVLSPLAIPAYERASIRKLNGFLLRQQVRWAFRRLGFRRVINWVFNPPAAVVAGSLGEDRLIYHCVDEYAAFTGVSRSTMEDFERSLLEKADLSIVTSEGLLETRRKIAPAAILVRHGVDVPHFRRALDPATAVPPDMASLPGPVIGFFGLIADWVDVELLAAVAKHFSGGSLVIVGKAVTDVSALRALPNVHLLGRKPYSELPGYCKGFDVALNPFRVNELTLNANPLKIREYLAAGLPVVATNIPEVARLGLCHIADGPEATIRAIEAALADPMPREDRSRSMQTESWESRLDDIRDHFAAMEAVHRARLS